jgi:hypothetical protein
MIKGLDRNVPPQHDVCRYFDSAKVYACIVMLRLESGSFAELDYAGSWLSIMASHAAYGSIDF